MKKFLTVLMLLMLCFSVVACGKEEPEPIPTVEPTPPPPPPTIEEILGFTGYDLLSYEFANPYNQVQLIANMDMTATHKNNIVDYVFESTKLHESDGYTSYSVISDSLTNEYRTENITHMAWVEKADSITKYYNDNYTGWCYTESTEDNISAKLYNSDKMTYSEMQGIGGVRLKVIGESVTSNNSYFDNYIKSIISQFGLTDCAYTFEANYDYTTREFISVTANVSVPGEITHGEYICTVDSLTVSMVAIESDTLKRLTVPDNCKAGVYVPSVVESAPVPIPEPTVTPETSTEPTEAPTESQENNTEEEDTEPTESQEPVEPTEPPTTTLPPLA